VAVRVLVTGASGMLGGAVARALQERGADVTVLQRRPSGLACREVLADVTDASALARAATGHDAVVHLAAKVDLSGPWRQFAATNIEGTRNVVGACEAAGIGRLVVVSSPSVAHAGRSLVGAGAEPADPARARGPYARSKAHAELLALAADRPGLAVVAVRPHLVWGPGDRQLVHRLVTRARAGRLVVVGPGTALVDTTYVDNAADAIVAALDRCRQAHGQALVVSNGEPRPVAELLTRICRAAGAPPPARRVPFRLAWSAGAAVDVAWAALRPSGEPPMTRFLAEQLATAHWFDQRRTRDVLAWAPAVRLDEGFARLARWFGSRDPEADGCSTRDSPGDRPRRWAGRAPHRIAGSRT
jgi:2-alkyl-3-oxoalkanoate reductase